VSVSPRRILRTSSFRLTLLYAGLFGCSALILLGVIYGATGAYMSSSLDAAIDSDLTELEDSLQAGGTEALTVQVAERLRRAPLGPMYYLLEDQDGRVIVGNIPSFQGGEGRFDLKVPKPNSQSVAVHAHGIALADHEYLMVEGFRPAVPATSSIIWSRASTPCSSAMRRPWKVCVKYLRISRTICVHR